MPRDRLRGDDARLWDMMRHSRELVEMTAGRSRADLDSDRVFLRAVERLIEIIGEAAHRVGDRTRKRHPEIQWRGIEAQRHVLAHEYGDIEHDKIWRVATIHVPELIRLLAPIVPAPPPDPFPESR